MKSDLLRKIELKSARVAVVGQGYVGLPLAIEICRSGFTTYGIDNDKNKISSLKNAKSYVGDISDDDLKTAIASGNYHPSDDFSVVRNSDICIICVPTPLSKTRDPDISYIINACESVIPHISKGKLIILESTTYPGTTREVILPRLVEKHYTVGTDFFLAFSPERVDPGNKTFTVQNTPKIIGGTTASCTEVAASFYSKVITRVIKVSSTEAAEMTKILENTFRAVNIGLINELAVICNKLGIDCWEVIEAASTKPYGFMPFYPGPGLGGHCIPIDPLYLTWRLKALNTSSQFIELADQINSRMPDVVVQKVARELNFKQKSVKGSKIFIIGVTYKKNISDVRESPALSIIERLEALGANIEYHDNFVPELRMGNQRYRSTELSPEVLKTRDCVLIVTNHDYIDYGMICENGTLIIDTRNATKPHFSEYRSKIARL